MVTAVYAAQTSTATLSMSQTPCAVSAGLLQHPNSKRFLGLSSCAGGNWLAPVAQGQSH